MDCRGTLAEDVAELLIGAAELLTTVLKIFTIYVRPSVTLPAA
jgi:hypothetical protein